VSGAKSFREVYGDDVADLVAGLASNPAQDDAARKAERERAETDRLTRHTQMVDQIMRVLRGELGRTKVATQAVEAIKRLLGDVEPRKAETAILVTCESIIRGAKNEIRKSRRPPPAGRGVR
jgi:hypothetical protein